MGYDGYSAPDKVFSTQEKADEWVDKCNKENDFDPDQTPLWNSLEVDAEDGCSCNKCKEDTKKLKFNTGDMVRHTFPPYFSNLEVVSLGRRIGDSKYSLVLLNKNDGGQIALQQAGLELMTIGEEIVEGLHELSEAVATGEPLSAKFKVEQKMGRVPNDELRAIMETLEATHAKEQEFIRAKHLCEQWDAYQEYLKEFCDCSCHYGGIDETGVCKQPCSDCQCPD